MHSSLDMAEMSSRISAWLIDKAIVLVLFASTIFVYCQVYETAFPIGKAVGDGLFDTPLSSIEYDYFSNVNPDLIENYKLFILLCLFCILIDCIYILVCEILFCRTIGKKIFGFIKCEKDRLKRNFSLTAFRLLIQTILFCILFVILSLILNNLLNIYILILTNVILISPLFFTEKEQTVTDLLTVSFTLNREKIENENMDLKKSYLYKTGDRLKTLKSSSLTIKGYKINRLYFILFLIWLSIQFTFFLVSLNIYGSERGYGFFPFADLKYYDISELFVYSILPVLVYVIRKILLSAKDDFK